MKGPEIVLATPARSTTYKGFRRFSYTLKNKVRSFNHALEGAGITPDTHPLAADLEAGDGSYARMLVDLGWNRANITCVDYRKTTTPLVQYCKWEYWDLEALDDALRRRLFLPKKVSALKEKFDLVIFESNKLEEERICNYLVRPEGYYYHHTWLYQKVTEPK